MAMSLFELIGALATAVAFFGYINHRFVRLPDTVGITAMALAVISRREVRPQIAATLAHRWFRGQDLLLRLLGSLPGVSLVPVLVQGGPFDLDRLFAKVGVQAQ